MIECCAKRSADNQITLKTKGRRGRSDVRLENFPPVSMSIGHLKSQPPKKAVHNSDIDSRCADVNSVILRVASKI